MNKALIILILWFSFCNLFAEKTRPLVSTAVQANQQSVANNVLAQSTTSKPAVTRSTGPMENKKVPDEAFLAGQALIIQIHADKASILNGGYPINADGYVDLPILGKIYVIDKSRYVLQTYLSEKMADYAKDTHVSVTPAIRIAFLGNFQRPGMYYVNPDWVIWDAFLMAQGPASDRDLKEMKIMRGSEVLGGINALDAFSNGQTLREAQVQSGDIFVLPIPSEKGIWFYFKDVIIVTASLATSVASVINVYLLYLNLQQ